MNYLISVFLPSITLGVFFLVQSFTQGYWPLVIGGWFLVCGFGVATGYHRVYAHRTHVPKPWLDYVLLFFGSLGGLGSSISWVSIHLDHHHDHSDTDQDIYSPVNGFWHSVVGWFLFLKPETVVSERTKHLTGNPRHQFFHKHYAIILFSWIALTAVISLTTGVKFFQAYLAVLFLSLLQETLVNIMCHRRTLGYRNTQTPDNSVNVWLLGYLGWGQGWHNSHHAHPDTFAFTDKWWEYDPCTMFLPLLNYGSQHDDPSAPEHHAFLKSRTL
jgi:fatty-acid desaturase